MVLAIAAEMNWKVVQLDVKTAFLYADIEEDVFVEMTPGYETTNRKEVQLVMKLGTSLYGLAQSPQNWWKTIEGVYLVEIGFIQLKSDTCVYIYNHNNTVVILTLYVRLHLQPQQYGRHPHSLCGRSPHHRRQHPSDRGYQGEGNGKVQDDGYG